MEDGAFILMRPFMNACYYFEEVLSLFLIHLCTLSLYNYPPILHEENYFE